MISQLSLLPTPLPGKPTLAPGGDGGAFALSLAGLVAPVSVGGGGRQGITVGGNTVPVTVGMAGLSPDALEGSGGGVPEPRYPSSATVGTVPGRTPPPKGGAAAADGRARTPDEVQDDTRWRAGTVPTIARASTAGDDEVVEPATDPLRVSDDNHREPALLPPDIEAQAAPPSAAPVATAVQSINQPLTPDARPAPEPISAATRAGTERAAPDAVGPAAQATGPAASAVPPSNVRAPLRLPETVKLPETPVEATDQPSPDLSSRPPSSGSGKAETQKLQTLAAAIPGSRLGGDTEEARSHEASATSEGQRHEARISSKPSSRPALVAMPMAERLSDGAPAPFSSSTPAAAAGAIAPLMVETASAIGQGGAPQASGPALAVSENDGASPAPPPPSSSGRAAPPPPSQPVHVIERVAAGPGEPAHALGEPAPEVSRPDLRASVTRAAEVAGGATSSTGSMLDPGLHRAGERVQAGLAITSGTAAQVFAADLRRSARDGRIIEGGSPASLLFGSVEPARLDAASAPQPASAPLDMRQERWPALMIERIERMRDAAEMADTRVRLIPDALGAIDVAVRREGDTTHVHFSAEQAATRALLQDAAPRLAEAAEARGLKLGQTAVGGGGPDSNGRQAPPAPPPIQPAPSRRRDVADDGRSDTRIA